MFDIEPASPKWPLFTFWYWTYLSDPYALWYQNVKSRHFEESGYWSLKKEMWHTKNDQTKMTAKICKASNRHFWNCVRCLSSIYWAVTYDFWCGNFNIWIFCESGTIVTVVLELYLKVFAPRWSLRVFQAKISGGWSKWFPIGICCSRGVFSGAILVFGGIGPMVRTKCVSFWKKEDLILKGLFGTFRSIHLEGVVYHWIIG